MLKIVNLVKKYGNFTAVDNLNLELEKGDIYGFARAQRCRKDHHHAYSTTLMRLLPGQFWWTESMLRSNRSGYGADRIYARLLWCIR